MIRETLERSVRDALVAVGVDPPASVKLERPGTTRARRLVVERGPGDGQEGGSQRRASWRPRSPSACTATPPPHVERVELAGPGFVNFRLRPTWLHDVLVDVVTQGDDGYARHDVGAGTRVNVEFVSANPTGPIHAGHGRGAAYGDSLARLLERCGYEVTREYYLNDRGHADAARSAIRCGRGKAGRPVPDDGYQGEYIAEWAAEMPDGADPVEWGDERVRRDHRAHARRDERRLRRVVQRAVARRLRADRATLADLARPRRRSTTPTARPGCAAPTSATTRTACSSRATASSPTCCPTSRTTATSSPAASTC